MNQKLTNILKRIREIILCCRKQTSEIDTHLQDIHKYSGRLNKNEPYASTIQTDRNLKRTLPSTLR